MAKVRAYKLAEELGIERSEFVERAAAEGVELKSPMAALEPEQVDLLREKLSSAPIEKSAMDEMRVKSKSGSTIVRRRRKKVVEPPVVEPAADPVVAAPVVSEEEPASLETPIEAVTPDPAVQPEPETTPAPAAAATDAPAPARKRPGAEEPPDRSPLGISHGEV